MKKAVVQVGYHQLVLDINKAVELVSMLHSAERFTEKWKRDESTKESVTSYYVYGNDKQEEMVTLRLMSDELYRLAKLAGKPTE